MSLLFWILAASLFGALAAGCVAFPHHLPRGLLYEIALIDLMARAKLTQIFPSLDQSWWHEILPGLYLGGIPLTDQRHLEQLKRLGVRSILAILEADEAEAKTFFSTPLKEVDWKKSEVDYRRLSCPDMQAMSLEELQEAVAWLHQKVLAKETVYVHCKAGRGRSAMIVIGYLIFYEKMEFKEAFDYLFAKRSVVRFRPCQMERLKEFSVSKISFRSKE